MSDKNFSGSTVTVMNPSNVGEVVGHIVQASQDDVVRVVNQVEAGSDSWAQQSAQQRAELLLISADLLEQHAVEMFVLLAREAGKTLEDAIAELREAVDFPSLLCQSCNQP